MRRSWIRSLKGRKGCVDKNSTGARRAQYRVIELYFATEWSREMFFMKLIIWNYLESIASRALALVHIKQEKKPSGKKSQKQENKSISLSKISVAFFSREKKPQKMALFSRFWALFSRFWVFLPVLAFFTRFWLFLPAMWKGA